MKNRNLVSQKEHFDGLSHPLNEDIFDNNEVEESVDPEDISKRKINSKSDKSYSKNNKEIENDESGDDLDIPGAELDDEEEETGSEDEENNYYSLGGDNHDNLEEDRGD